jgi:hypothetical protein
MDIQFLRISDLPQPSEVRQSHAFNYHVDRYQRWLVTAGASPRVAVALCPDESQLQALTHSLEAKDVEVEQVVISSSRLIPEPVLRHQGDHFNRRLFVVSGFEAGADGTDTWHGLDRYVDHYAKVATWVLFVIKDAPSLVAFAENAPQLWSRVGRCIPVAGAITLNPQSEQSGRWSNAPRLEYACAVLSGLNGRCVQDYHQWARFCRVGYAHRTQSSTADTNGANLHSFWHESDGFSESEPLAKFGDQLPIWIGEAVTRHGTRGTYPWVSPQWKGMEDRYLIKQLSAFHDLFRSNAVPTQAEIDSFRESYTRQTSPDLQIEAYFVDAQLYAHSDNLEGMIEAFDTAVTVGERASLEAHYEALYRMTEVFILLDQHTDAKRWLGRLAEFETQLMSPVHEARFLLLKGRFLLGLDPLKGTEVLADAYRLFAAHGYPEYTEQVQALTDQKP